VRSRRERQGEGVLRDILCFHGVAKDSPARFDDLTGLAFDQGSEGVTVASEYGIDHLSVARRGFDQSAVRPGSSWVAVSDYLPSDGAGAVSPARVTR
jgi:hypothetical protein